jgi:hypothetical protein
MTVCPDFEYLCLAAEKAGWMVGISIGDFIERPREDKVGRRCLGAIKLRRDRKSPVKVEVPIADNLALASRIALDELLAQRGAA